MPRCLQRSHFGMPWSQRVLLILHGSHEAGFPFRRLAFLGLVSQATIAIFCVGVCTCCVALCMSHTIFPVSRYSKRTHPIHDNEKYDCGRQTWQRNGEIPLMHPAVASACDESRLQGCLSIVCAAPANRTRLPDVQERVRLEA